MLSTLSFSTNTGLVGISRRHIGRIKLEWGRDNAVQMFGDIFSRFDTTSASGVQQEYQFDIVWI